MIAKGAFGSQRHVALSGIRGVIQCRPVQLLQSGYVIGANAELLD